MRQRTLSRVGLMVALSLGGCATSLPISNRDRGLILSVADVFPTLPERAKSSESLQKRRWLDGSVDLTYNYRGRHDSVPVLLFASVGSWPNPNVAAVARAEGDVNHRRLLSALEQRESDSYIPVGPEAKTNLLFAGMQPVGLTFSTQLANETYTVLCLAPPQFFSPHRTRDLVIERVERLRAAIRR